MSLILFIFVILALLAGYVFYGNYVSAVFDIDPQKKTPAYTKYDGVDYVPAKNWLIIFGHHFASIAGAGPIIGPVLAYMLWGWAGTLVWIIIGSIFMGAVHDFSSLVVSLKEEGVSIGQVAAKYISKRASILFLLYLWFALVIIVAIFAAICAKSFITQPEVIVSSLGLIPVAVLVGFLIYKLKINLFISTLFGLASLAALIYLGGLLPIKLSGVDPYFVWVTILLVYAFFASVIPVNILLQPRDYLSSFLLFFGIAVSFIGIFSRPFSLEGAKVISFGSKVGFIFPMMFITVACGAISGFHSLVASGTTSKQLNNEGNAKRVGFGAMLLEAVLAVIVLFAVAFGLKTIPKGVSEPAEIFALGFSKISYFLGDYAKFIALVILNAFILTTLDSATRITRLLTQEIFKFNNKWLATALVISAGAYLALMNKWQVLWPVFGAANQLVAGLALIVVSGWLFCKGKKYLFAFIPAIIMIGITITALGFKIVDFFQKKDYTLCVVSFILIVLGVWGLFEFRKMTRCRLNGKIN
ncbi:MAG: carbon starvation protein A [Candidatus Omnitrophica bacterium]|nr:carbon starvation protein A [Candidatus Omnitrophota bacterium]